MAVRPVTPATVTVRARASGRVSPSLAGGGAVFWFDQVGRCRWQAARPQPGPQQVMARTDAGCVFPHRPGQHRVGCCIVEAPAVGFRLHIQGSPARPLPIGPSRRSNLSRSAVDHRPFWLLLLQVLQAASGRVLTMTSTQRICALPACVNAIPTNKPRFQRFCSIACVGRSRRGQSRAPNGRGRR